MRYASGFPVEGITLSQLVRVPGHPTGVSVLDDFLPWQGLPASAVTILEGSHAGHLMRKVLSCQDINRKSVWIHTLHHRPFFQESENCFRLQVPDEKELVPALKEILREGVFENVVLHLTKPLSRSRALELFEIAKNSSASLIVISRQGRLFPWELADLVVEAFEDFLAVRKAQNRPVPLWIPAEMLESIDTPSEEGVLSWDHACEAIPS